MQIFLPLICYNHTCHTSYMMSIIKMMMIFTKEKINIALYPITFDSLINRARNAAVAQFLSDPDNTHLLFIDSDIEFSVDLILRMIREDKDVMGIGYAQKWLNIGKMKQVFSELNVPKDPIQLCTNASIHLIPGEKGPVQEVEYCTTGCLLIKRHVIEKMMEKYPERKFMNDVDAYMGSDPEKFYNLFCIEIHPETKRLESEDYAFCRLWREMGGKIHVLLDANLRHHGWFGYDNNIYRQLQYFNIKDNHQEDNIDRK